METAITLTRSDFIQKDDGLWMTSEQLGNWLGYKQPNVAIGMILNRNQEELNPFTSINKLLIEGRTRDARLFDEQGCYIVAMLARTEKAKAFRKALALLLRELQRNSFRFEEINDNYKAALRKIALSEIEVYFSATLGRRIIDLRRMMELKNTLNEQELGRLFHLSVGKIKVMINYIDRIESGEDVNIIRDFQWPVEPVKVYSPTNKGLRNARIIDLYLKNNSIREIQRLTGVSRRTITIVIDQSGVLREEVPNDQQQ